MRGKRGAGGQRAREAVECLLFPAEPRSADPVRVVIGEAHEVTSDRIVAEAFRAVVLPAAAAAAAARVALLACDRLAQTQTARRHLHT